MRASGRTAPTAYKLALRVGRLISETKGCMKSVSSGGRREHDEGQRRGDMDEVRVVGGMADEADGVE